MGVWDSRRVVKRWRVGSDPPATGWSPFFGKPSPGVKVGEPDRDPGGEACSMTQWGPCSTSTLR